MTPNLVGMRFLYVIRGGPQLCKIGVSTDVKKRLENARFIRLRGPGNKYGRIDAPEKLTIVWTKNFRSVHVWHVEACIKHLLQHRSHPSGAEWFIISPTSAVVAIKEVLKSPCRTAVAASRFISRNDPW